MMETNPQTDPRHAFTGSGVCQVSACSFTKIFLGDCWDNSHLEAMFITETISLLLNKSPGSQGPLGESTCAEVQPDPETHYPERKIGSLVEKC